MEPDKLLSTIPAFYQEYKSILEQAGQNLHIEGKTLEFANREQSSWISYYYQRKVEVEYIVKRLDTRVDATRGEIYRKYKERHSRELGEREINRYIDADPEYIKIKELYLMVWELWEKYKAVCDAFTQRGFSLRNITEARIAQMENAQL